AEVDEDGAAVGEEAPGLFVGGGGEVEEVALLGEGGELEVGGEVVGAEVDGGGEGVVDVVVGLLGGGGGGRVGGMADAVEDAAGFGLLLGLEGEEGVL